METTQTTPASAPSSEAHIQALLNDSRAQAYEALNGFMSSVFYKIGLELACLEEDSPDEADNLMARKQTAGLSNYTLRMIRNHFDYDDYEEWLAGGLFRDKSRFISEFLNLKAMQMEEFKSRFPNAFKKWTKEEDTSLLEHYKRCMESSEPLEEPDEFDNWDYMSFMLGRNVNAIKLRLEKLGIDLGPDAGRPRRERSTAR